MSHTTQLQLENARAEQALKPQLATSVFVSLTTREDSRLGRKCIRTEEGSFVNHLS